MTIAGHHRGSDGGFRIETATGEDAALRRSRGRPPDTRATADRVRRDQTATTAPRMAAPTTIRRKVTSPRISAPARAAQKRVTSIAADAATIEESVLSADIGDSLVGPLGAGGGPIGSRRPADLERAAVYSRRASRSLRRTPGPGPSRPAAFSSLRRASLIPKWCAISCRTTSSTAAASRGPSPSPGPTARGTARSCSGPRRCPPRRPSAGPRWYRPKASRADRRQLTRRRLVLDHDRDRSEPIAEDVRKAGQRSVDQRGKGVRVHVVDHPPSLTGSPASVVRLARRDRGRYSRAVKRRANHRPIARGEINVADDHRSRRHTPRRQ